MESVINAGQINIEGEQKLRLQRSAKHEVLTVADPRTVPAGYAAGVPGGTAISSCRIAQVVQAL